MHGLEKSINILAAQETDKKVRDNAVNLLTSIIDDINSGINLWNKFLKSGKAPEEKGLYNGWAGHSIERPLFDLELAARAKASEATNGGSSLDKPLVSLAYSKLDDDETAKDAANAAIAASNDRITRIKALINTIKTTKPKKPAASKPAEKTPSASKSTAKKAAPTKKAETKEKVATKKKAAAKKKAAKKAAPKKKVAQRRRPQRKRRPRKR